jgi:hypothetical protein
MPLSWNELRANATRLSKALSHETREHAACCSGGISVHSEAPGVRIGNNAVFGEVTATLVNPRVWIAA